MHQLQQRVQVSHTDYSVFVVLPRSSKHAQYVRQPTTRAIHIRTPPAPLQQKIQLERTEFYGTECVLRSYESFSRPTFTEQVHYPIQRMPPLDTTRSHLHALFLQHEI